MYKRILILLLLIAVLARITALTVTPETSYVDALIHSSITQETIENQTLTYSSYSMPPPYYHLLAASSAVLILQDFSPNLVHIFPLVLTIIFVLISYLFFREALEKNHLLAFVLTLGCSWLVRYGAVNYIDTVSATLLMLSLFLFLRFSKTKKNSWLVFLVLSVACLSISKLNATIFIPIFLVAIPLQMKKLNFSLNKSIFAFVVILLFSSFWFDLNVVKYGTPFASVASSGEIVPSVSETNSPISMLFALPESLASIYDFPPTESFERVGIFFQFPVEVLMAIFLLVFLPITVLAILGFISLLKEKTIFNYSVAAILIVAFLFVIYVSWRTTALEGALYTRYLIPAMPLLSLIFVKGFNSVNKEMVKKITFTSFVLLMLYCFSYSSFSAFYYQGIHQQHIPLYESCELFPADAKLLADREAKALGLFCGTNSSWINGFNNLTNEEAHFELKSNSLTHIVVGCYRPSIDKSKLMEMSSLEYLEKVYDDGCSVVYEVV